MAMSCPTTQAACILLVAALLMLSGVSPMGIGSIKVWCYSETLGPVSSRWTEQQGPVGGQNLKAARPVLWLKLKPWCQNWRAS